MLLRRHGSGEVVDSCSLGQMLDLLKSHNIYERLFARDALYMQVDAKVFKGKWRCTRVASSFGRSDLSINRSHWPFST
jgi:hypothetical protein